MKRIAGNKKGQFIIIGMLIIAIMIISTGAIMHRAATYYRHERWAEYLSLMGDIELSANKLVELSLCNYTHSNDAGVLAFNIKAWQNDLATMYPGYGIGLSCDPSNGPVNLGGVTVDYSSGLGRVWDKNSSISVANASFTVNVASMGLTGYKFSTPVMLNLTVLNATGTQIYVSVRRENNQVFTDLEKENFLVTSYNIKSVVSLHDQKNIHVYLIELFTTVSTPFTVSAWDHRGIKVAAQYPTS